MRGFLGITCHFIINWSLKSAMLECKRFKGQHTAENIAHCYDETVTSHGKIITKITDNASNVVKAMSLPGFEDASFSASDSDDDEDVDETASVSVDEDELRELVTDKFLCKNTTLPLLIPLS